MFKGKRISVIFPAYNEEESIAAVIKDFAKIKEVDEIVVVDNNCKDNTVAIAKKTKLARIVKQPKQGYGHAIMMGLSKAIGDILVTCDADMTYRASDIRKLLKESSKYDFVWSSRTNTKYLLPGGNMGFTRRWANIILSKFIQIRFGGNSLTDLGATFRLLNRKPYEAIKNKLSVGNGSFQPELTILALKNGFKVKEVPVYYGPRSGESKISGSLMGGIKTAKKMLDVIIGYTLGKED